MISKWIFYLSTFFPCWDTFLLKPKNKKKSQPVSTSSIKAIRETVSIHTNQLINSTIPFEFETKIRKAIVEKQIATIPLDVNGSTTNGRNNLMLFF